MVAVGIVILPCGKPVLRVLEQTFQVFKKIGVHKLYARISVFLKKLVVLYNCSIAPLLKKILNAMHGNSWQRMATPDKHLKKTQLVDILLADVFKKTLSVHYNGHPDHLKNTLTQPKAPEKLCEEGVGDSERPVKLIDFLFIHVKTRKIEWPEKMNRYTKGQPIFGGVLIWIFGNFCPPKPVDGGERGPI